MKTVLVAALALLALPVLADPTVNTGSVAESPMGEWLPSTAVTTLPTTTLKPSQWAGTAYALPSRKTITIENQSSTVTCCATFDPQPPVTTATGCSLGFRLRPGDLWSFDKGGRLPVKMACTGATATGAGIMVEQSR